jgi:hypothetical protein
LEVIRAVSGHQGQDPDSTTKGAQLAVQKYFQVDGIGALDNEDIMDLDPDGVVDLSSSDVDYDDDDESEPAPLDFQDVFTPDAEVEAGDEKRGQVGDSKGASNLSPFFLVSGLSIPQNAVDLWPNFFALRDLDWEKMGLKGVAKEAEKFVGGTPFSIEGQIETIDPSSNASIDIKHGNKILTRVEENPAGTPNIYGYATLLNRDLWDLSFK